MRGETLARIRERGHIGIRLGLGRMRAMLAALGDPQHGLRGVLIAGTNGKGSVAAMVAAMYLEAGLRTSQSPSPHLSSYRERILIDGQPIAEVDLERVLQEVLEASEAGEARYGPATEFELLTAAAYLWSARSAVDVAIIEVGLGGRLDATNTWHADVAAVTNVSLDHQQFLGDTIESIAREKAAIIKRHGRAVTTATGAALTVIERRARRLDVPLRTYKPLVIERMDLGGLVLRHERLGRLQLPFTGHHQAANAAAALGIVEVLGEAGVAAVDDATMVRGLSRTRWPGRLELIDHAGQLVLLDGAHNPDGAAVLAATLDALADQLPRGRVTLLLGVMEDKAVADILASLTSSRLLAASQFVASGVPDSDRALSATALAIAWETATGSHPAAIHDDADAALQTALELATRAGGALVVAGSLYLVGHLRTRLMPAAAWD